ncbi:hypothetical protein AC579_3766, partial [Pseudocercospora musae]
LADEFYTPYMFSNNGGCPGERLIRADSACHGFCDTIARLFGTEEGKAVKIWFVTTSPTRLMLVQHVSLVYLWICLQMLCLEILSNMQATTPQEGLCPCTFKRHQVEWPLFVHDA